MPRVVIEIEARKQFEDWVVSDLRWGCTVAHRRCGKTYVSLQRLVNKALLFPRSDGRFGYIAPFLKQAKQNAWSYLKAFTQNIPNVSTNESELSVTLPNGSFIRIYGADNPDSLRGTYWDGAILDEVADFKPFVWGEIIRPALIDRKDIVVGGAWCYFIGTPKGMNLFHEIWQRALSSDQWLSLMLRGSETGIIPDDELEQLRDELSENEYRQEIECDFTASQDNVMITIDEAQAASERQYKPEDYQFAAKILSVDVARFGDDRSVIVRRQGLVAFEPIIFKGIDNMTLAGHVMKHINEWQPDATFIDSGRGEGVIDRCRMMGHDIIEVPFGGKPTNQRYLNKRSEMWYEMAEWIRKGGAIPNNLELKSDLVNPTYSYNSAGKIQMISKEEMKKLGFNSPDIADALALSFTFPVSPSHAYHSSEPEMVTHVDFDPYA